MARLKFAFILLVCSVLAGVAPAARRGRSNRLFNGYIIQVAARSDAAQLGQGTAERIGGRLGHVYRRAVTGFSIQAPAGMGAEDLLRLPGVVAVEPDVIVHAVAQTLPTGVDRIDADSSGVTTPVDVDIAILDTGIDRDHPDLNVAGGRRFRSILWWSLEDDRYDDDNGHGTHCAGIAAARDNDIGVVGVAPGARVWAVKVLDRNGEGYLSDVIAGVDWVTANASTIEAANLSLSAVAHSSIFRTAIQQSVSAGVVYTVAAGNDGIDVYGSDGVLGTSDDIIPAAYPEAATISAMVDTDGRPGGLGGADTYGSDDSFASFTNYSRALVAGNPVSSPGRAIDLLLPGVRIYSCWLNGGYASASGTSMASPHAVGLAALYIAGHGRATSAGGVYAIRQALIDAGVNQTDPTRGLATQNDPDANNERIGWAGSSQTEPPTLTSIQVTPQTASIQIGDSQQYTATGTYSDNSTADVTDAADWTSSVPSVASVDVGGLAAALAEGSTLIRASLDGVTSSAATLTVTAAPEPATLESILVEPQDASILVGADQQYTATGTYSDDSTAEITYDVAWTSSAPAVATIDSYGLATGQAEGSATIAAALDDVTSNDAALTVAAEPDLLAHVTIDMVKQTLWRWWKAHATVTVRENHSGGAPLAQVVVRGHWEGLQSGPVSGMTNSGGSVTLRTNWLRSQGSVTLVIDSITKDGQTYALSGEITDSISSP